LSNRTKIERILALLVVAVNCSFVVGRRNKATPKPIEKWWSPDLTGGVFPTCQISIMKWA
ncbi:MAG: hypothetical protein NT075_35485, partial [Chloroflexi bacterium]|nr:hypothetical protein [Chloroflexota bacterium]